MMSAFEGPKPKPSADVERIGDLQRIMQEYVLALTKNERSYYERAKALTPRFLPPEDLRRQSFIPNAYYIEPFALADLEAAKKQNVEAKIAHMRVVIHAYSWASHGPVNPDKARELAETFEKSSITPGKNLSENPFEEQGALLDPEASQWEAVAQVAGRMEYAGDKLEKPVRFIEKKIEETWKEFKEQWKGEKNNKELPWPESRSHTDKRELPADLDALEKKLIKLRMIRDQLYFQRLYPKLAAFGHAGIKK